MPVIGGINIPDEFIPSAVGRREQKRDSLGAIFEAGAVRAGAALRYGLPAAVERVAGTLTPEDEQYYAAWQRAKNQRAQEIAPTGAAGFSDLSLAGGKVGLGRFLGENVAQMVPYLTGSLVGGLAGGAVGGPGGAAAGAIAVGTPLFAGTNAARALEETGGLTEQQATASLAVAPLQSAADFLGARFLPGAGKLFGPLAARFESKATGLAGAAVRGGKGALAGAATEALTETAQQVGERFAVGLPMTDADAMREYVQAFGTAAVIGGAFGGVTGSYRKKIQAQPAAETTNEDLNSVVDEAILALPAPTMFTDAAGRSATGQAGFDDLLKTPRPPGFAPEQAAEPLALPPPDPSRDVLFGAPDVPASPSQAETALAQELSGQPSGDLKAILERAADPKQGVPPMLVEAVTRELGSREASPSGGAPVSATQQPVVAAQAPAATEPTFEERVADLKKGRKNDFIAKLEPADETDLLDQVYTQVFDKQDERVTTAKFAQKLGILDENLEPTDLAREIEARRAQPAAAPDPAFAQELETIKQGTYDPEIKSLTATTPEELDAQVYRAMAGRTGFTEEERTADLAAGRKGTISSPSDAMETLAQMRGIYDDQGQLTEKGRTLALAEPVSTADAAAEAITQGFTGKFASSFERGAQGLPFVAPQSSGALGDIAGLEVELEQAKQAYAAGQAWKVPPVTASVTQSEAAVDKLAPSTRAQTQGAIEVPEIQLTAPQRTAQRLNLKLDEARLPETQSAEVRGLKALIAKGEIADEATLQEQIDLVNAGWSVVGPEYYNRETPFVPAQPVGRLGRALGDANTAAKQELAAQKLGVGQQGKAATRAETARLVQKKLLREEVRAAHESGDIDRVTFMRLTDALSEGRIEAVKAGLPGASFSQEQQVTGLDAPVEHQVKTEMALKSGTLDSVLKYLKAEAPSDYHRELADKIAKAMKALMGTGISFDLNIIHEGDMAPSVMRRARGSASWKVDSVGNSMTVWLRGVGLAHPGVNYETVAHEMVHAATMVAIEVGRRPKTAGARAYTPAVQDLIGVFNQVISHFNNRARAGNMTAFEAEIYKQQNNSLQDPHEMLAWVLTNPEMQAYLDTIEVTPTQSLFGRLIEALSNLLGLSPLRSSALSETVRVADRLFQDVAADPPLISENGELVALQQSMIRGSVAEMGAALRQTIPQINTAAATAKLPDKMAAGRRALLGFLSVDHMAQVWGKKLDGLADISRIDSERHATDAKFSQLMVGWYQDVLQTPAAAQKALGELMRMTEFGADPTKRWEDQEHLHTHPNAAGLKTELAKANTAYNNLRRVGLERIYDDARALNETMLYAELAVRLSSIVNFDPEYKLELPGFAPDLTAQFREDLAASADPQAAKAYWKGALEQRVEMAKAFIEAQRGVMIRVDPAGQSKIEQHLSPLEAQIKEIAKATTRASRSPYFHLGRHGDQFVAFAVKNQNGVADKGSILKLVNALSAAGFGDKLYVSTETGRANVYFRGETIEQARQIEALAKKLKADGALDPEVDIIGGPREASGKGAATTGKQGWIDTMLQQLKSDPAFDTTGLSKDEKKEVNARRNAIEKQLQEMWLDTVSDNSLAKVMTNRKAVPGYEADMVRNFAQRGQMSTKALANITAAPRYNEALGRMRAAVNDARRVESPLHDEVQGMFDVVEEIKQRQLERGQVEQTVVGDKLRAFTNAALLGMSPSYVLLQMTQIPVLLYPELGAKHGFVRAAKAIAGATGPAFRIMAETLKAARATGDWKHLGDVALTPAVIKAAGLNPGEAKFIAKKIADGDIDIGGAAREMGWISDGRIGSKKEAALRLASAMGLYAETLTRLIAALAARNLYSDGKVKVPLEEYAGGVIKNAMFNYATSNTARQLGKTGLVGQATPLVTQFYQYSAQLMEKLYREGYDAFKGETQAERNEARKFLAAHATAVVAFAGMLGLPLAAPAAWAVEKLVDLFDDDDEPYDATAAFRRYMAEMFGDGVGDMLSRGVIPRGLGFDLSTRAGEQNILPFTELLLDQRDWKDAIGAQTERSFGAAFSVGTSMVTGASKMLQGDLYGGAVEMAPVALKGPLKAGRMAATGEYIDAKGNRLPMTAGSSAVLYQLLGLNSAERAKYTEKASDQAGRRISLNREATVLRNKIVKAVMRGETDIVDLIRDAQKFDTDNPAYAVLPDIEGAVTRRLKAEAVGRTLGTPLGVRATDLEAQELTRY